MNIERDGKIYTLTSDELFDAYEEQLIEFIKLDARDQISDLIIEGSMPKDANKDYEHFIDTISASAHSIYLKSSISREEAVHVALNTYLMEHDHKFPFVCKLNMPTSLF
jgi:hypothetical protein